MPPLHRFQRNLATRPGPVHAASVLALLLCAGCAQDVRYEPASGGGGGDGVTVKFVNAASNHGALDVFVAGTDEPLVAGLDYLAISSAVDLPAELGALIVRPHASSERVDTGLTFPRRANNFLVVIVPDSAQQVALLPMQDDLETPGGDRYTLRVVNGTNAPLDSFRLQHVSEGSFEGVHAIAPHAWGDPITVPSGGVAIDTFFVDAPGIAFHFDELVGGGVGYAYFVGSPYITRGQPGELRCVVQDRSSGQIYEADYISP